MSSSVTCPFLASVVLGLVSLLVVPLKSCRSCVCIVCPLDNRTA